MRVLVLTRYERLGASSRVRFLQFLPALEREGFVFEVQPLLSNEYVKALYGGAPVSKTSFLSAYARRFAALHRRLQYDVIWLEKEALPWLPAWVEIARLQGIPYVVDFDDAWFYRYENHWSRALLGRKLDKVMLVARTVVAGNEFIARRARHAGARRVEIVPSVVDLARYDHLQTRKVGGPLNIGWIGHPLTAPYLDIVAPALHALTDVNVQVVGSQLPPSFDGIRSESLPWTEASEVALIAEFDVGIMPLTDSPWERGKCAYKLIQVMAAGKPVVASPVGANRSVIQHGVNGFLAETTEQWIEALRRLSDHEERNRMGQQARRTVAEHYAQHVVVPRLSAVLREASDSQ